MTAAENKNGMELSSISGMWETLREKLAKGDCLSKLLEI